LRQLEIRIATSPADAIAYLAWSCYQAPPFRLQKPHKKKKAVRTA
jgi:hypothetical protein